MTLQIEVQMANPRLSASILKQLPTADDTDAPFLNMEALGFVRNVLPGKPLVGIFKDHETGAYFTLPLDYKMGTGSFVRRVSPDGKSKQEIHFDSTKECVEWMDKYKDAVERAMDGGQIFI